MASSDAELDDAVTRAARLLRESNAPVIAVAGVDVAAIVGAFRLAQRLGAVIDHAGAEAALRDQAVLQDIGLMLVSPAEARRRADTLLLVGDGPLQVSPEFRDLLSGQAGGGGAGTERRRIVALTSKVPDPPGAVVTWLKAEATTLPSLLAALRARLNGRPVTPGFAEAAEIEQIADLLKAASFGVALWRADDLAALTIEMIAGLIKDLNFATRWSGLSVSVNTSLEAAAMASGWMTGLPLRTNYAGVRPTHDPWQYSAQRMVESGEADALVWISALSDPLPDWVGTVPTIVLSPPASPVKSASAIRVPVGRLSDDHDGVVYDHATGTLTETVARAPSNISSAAAILRRLFDALAPP